MNIQIKKFKKINDVTVELSAVNIFIGTNNSGKSSFIQGIQFAVSGCQTLNLNNGVWTRNGTQTLSIDSGEFLYNPTSKIEYLYHGKRLTGSRTKKDRNWIEFIFTDKNIASIKISRGKNGGFTTLLTGRVLGEKLGNIKKPFCVYVPGIAGIPIQEKYEAVIAVKKSATRGDSNNYLRNILYSVSINDGQWAAFKDSVNKIYPDTDLRVVFDDQVSEFIHVFVINSGLELPLDSVGTGLLQVIQIFAYIEYFIPKLILLDEPDSHIHPTKQKLLAEELFIRTTANDELKIIFSTHSRYILEALEGKAKVFHFRNGYSYPDIKGSKILLDIGAADADYLFAKKNLKYVVVTEDKVDNIVEKKEFLKKFLIANGLNEDEFVLHSYEGCTKVDFAKILEGFVRKQIPVAKVIVHIDRDQRVDTDREIIKLKDDCVQRDIMLFVTKYQEVESYFCLPKHISNIYQIPIIQAETQYNKFVAELESETRRKLTNFILRERPELSRNKGNQVDIDVVNKHVDEWYNQYKNELTPGKELLGKIKVYAQEILKVTPDNILGGRLKRDDMDGLFDKLSTRKSAFTYLPGSFLTEYNLVKLNYTILFWTTAIYLIHLMQSNPRNLKSLFQANY